jgi:AcrR family transcriptional regulator
MAGTKPLRRDAQRNRERILEAAREVFAERGVDATLDDVAARAGVGVGTVYRRYANKDALLDELLETVVTEIAEFAEAALDRPDGWEALIAVLERLEEKSAANRALEHLVMQRDRERPLEHVAHARERLLVPLAALVERARADGRLRADFDIADVRDARRGSARPAGPLAPLLRDRRPRPQPSSGGAAPYSSSVTCSPHVALLPSSSTWTSARWVMNLVAAAPCQCSSPGSKKTPSPGRMISTGPPRRCARPTPSST